MLVVVGDFDLVGISRLPAKTDTELIVDADTVLTLPVTPQPFQPIPRWDLEFANLSHPVQLVQFASRHGPNRLRTDTASRRSIRPVKDILGCPITE